MESLVIVGPGRVGLTLGAALLQARGLESLTYFGRSMEQPPHPVFDSSEPTVEYRVGIQPVPQGTTVVLLAVPDRALPEVAHELAHTGQAPAGCAALHVSGAVSADVLAPLHGVGYAVGSFHPLRSFADPWAAGAGVAGTTFGISGEPAAVAAGRRLAALLSGKPVLVSPRDRALYHAAAVMASNYTVTLFASALSLMETAAVAPSDATGALLDLMRGTLDNIEHLSSGSALTGPIARGDTETVRLHLARLSGPDRELYCALGRATLRLARAAGLDPQRAEEFARLLAG